MKKPISKVVCASRQESELRKRKIQILLNVIEPDPEYQAFFVSDEACALDVSGVEPELVRARLEFYLGGPLPGSLRTPLWKLCDQIQERHPLWPEEWPPEPS